MKSAYIQIAEGLMREYQCCLCQAEGRLFFLALINGKPCAYLEDTNEWWPVENWTVSDDYSFHRVELRRVLIKPISKPKTPKR